MDPVIRYDFGNVFVSIIFVGGIGNILFILVVQIMRLKLIMKRWKNRGWNCCKKWCERFFKAKTSPAQAPIGVD